MNESVNEKNCNTAVKRASESKARKWVKRITALIAVVLLGFVFGLNVYLTATDSAENTSTVAYAESYDQIVSKEKQYLLIPSGTTFVGYSGLSHNEYYSSTLYLAVGQDIIMFNFGIYDSVYIDTPNVLNSVDSIIGGNYITFEDDIYLPFSYNSYYLDSSICFMQCVDNAGNVYELTLNPVPVTFEIVTITFYNSTDLNNSYNNGFNAGKNSVDTDSYYNQGYEEGYQAGLNDGDVFWEGFEEGRAEGYELGWRDGFKSGSNFGYDDGYDDGLNKGHSDQITANPVSTFLEPIQTFLATPLFGDFSIGIALSVGLFVSLALIFIKMFAGG